MKLLNAKLLMSNFSTEAFSFKYFQHCLNTVLSQNTLISQEVFSDCQVSLKNTTNLNNALEGGDI